MAYSPPALSSHLSLFERISLRGNWDNSYGTYPEWEWHLLVLLDRNDRLADGVALRVFFLHLHTYIGTYNGLQMAQSTKSTEILLKFQFANIIFALFQKLWLVFYARKVEPMIAGHSRLPFNQWFLSYLQSNFGGKLKSMDFAKWVTCTGTDLLEF